MDMAMAEGMVVEEEAAALQDVRIAFVACCNTRWGSLTAVQSRTRHNLKGLHLLEPVRPTRIPTIRLAVHEIFWHASQRRLDIDRTKGLISAA